MLRVLSWNILHGGGSRVAEILEVIAGYNADILTLQEYRHGKNHALFMSTLAELGYRWILAPSTNSARENSVLLASKFELTGDGFPEQGVVPYRAIKAEVSVSNGFSLNLVCVHFPHKKAQVPLFEALHGLPGSWLNDNSLLIGDFNCGIPFVDSETKSFYATHLFQQLLSDGWIDSWRSRHEEVREYTWYSTQRSNGFRYDHALLSRDLDQSVASIGYDHDVRINKLSDHSLLVLDLNS